MSTTTGITLHGVKSIRAQNPGTFGAPIIHSLASTDHHQTSTVTIFLDDHALVDRLVGAINGAQGPIYNPPHDHQEAAAYTAQTTLFGDER